MHADYDRTSRWNSPFRSPRGLPYSRFSLARTARLIHREMIRVVLGINCYVLLAVERAGAEDYSYRDYISEKSIFPAEFLGVS